jgi:predicted dehydrogenase
MSGLLTLQSGIHVSVLQTCETRLEGSLAGYTLYGDSGTLRAWKDGYEVFDDGPTSRRSTYELPRLSDYAQEIEAFADYVMGADHAPTTGVSERRSLASVQAGYESAASGQPVHLSARFGAL